MQIETEIEVKFRTTLGDSFDDDTSKKEQKDMIEQHIEDFCDEHKIDRSDVRIVR